MTSKENYMKVTLISLLCFCSALSLSAQNRLDAPELEQTLSPEEFSDVVKSVWDIVKKGTDDYQDATLTRSEFETASEFDNRLQRRHDEIAANIQTFVESKKIDQRLFATLLPATLVKYNADTQTYGVTTATRILVPPNAPGIVTTCPQNTYVSLVETNKKGYKFAHLVLNTKPEYTWHVDKTTARAAKDNEQNVFFKVWFRFDLSQAFMGGQARFTIVPVKIALWNKGDNITYWSDDITK
jgi:hypothetical protein